jgi:hypothetical protein
MAWFPAAISVSASPSPVLTHAKARNREVELFRNPQMVLQRNQWNISAPGRASVPRATGPARGTESQSVSFGGRFALEKLNTLRLEWLERALVAPANAQKDENK